VVSIYMCTGRCIGRNPDTQQRSWTLTTRLWRGFTIFSTPKHIDAKLCVLRMTSMGWGRSYTIDWTLFWKAERPSSSGHARLNFPSFEIFQKLVAALATTSAGQAKL
jgi:hypothetical protein